MQVETVDELGRLHEHLKAEPSIATHIRAFSLFWDPADTWKWITYPTEHGSLLDMAFIDKGALWAETAQAAGVVVHHQGDHDAYFMLGDEKYEEPGIRREHSSGQHSARAALQCGNTVSHPLCQNILASGPDGMGPDKRIKNASDFNDCITEVVALLAAGLRGFAWSCDVTQMPFEVFQALKGSLELEYLDLDLSIQGHNVELRECEDLSVSHALGISSLPSSCAFHVSFHVQRSTTLGAGHIHQSSDNQPALLQPHPDRHRRGFFRGRISLAQSAVLLNAFS